MMLMSEQDSASSRMSFRSLVGEMGEVRERWLLAPAPRDSARQQTRI
jgi:hypothetical protein